MDTPNASTVSLASVTLKLPASSAVFVVHRFTSSIVDLLRIVGLRLKTFKQIRHFVFSNSLLRLY